MAQDIRLAAIHLCDSVSRDLRGLPTLLNIYPGKVRCPLKPWYQKFVVFMVFERDEAQTQNISFRVTAPSASSEGEIEISSGGPYVDLHMTFSMLVPDDGELAIDWKVGDGRWRKGARWSFVFPEKVKELKKSESDALKEFFTERMKVHEILERIEVSSISVKY